MNGPRAVHRFTSGTADQSREQGILGQRIDALPLKPEDRLPAATRAASCHWATVLIAGLFERVARLVHPSPPETSTRASLEEATHALRFMQAELDVSLHDLDAASWEALDQQLDRVNDLLRSVVEDVAARRAPPRPG